MVGTPLPRLDVADLEVRWRDIAETVAFGITVHRGGVIEWANAAFAEAVGLDHAELPGRNLAEVLGAPADLESEDQPTGDPGGDLPTRRFEIARRRPDGSERILLVRSRPVDPPDSSRFLTSVLDVTDARCAQQDLRQRLDLENALTGVTGLFLSLRPESFSGGLEEGLARLGRAARAREIVLLVFPEADFPGLLLRWHADGNSIDSSAPTRALIETIMGWFPSNANEARVESGAEAGRPLLGFGDDPGSGHATACLPLIGSDGVIGVLGHAWIGSDHEPEAHDLRVLRVGAEILSSAIRRQRAEVSLRRQRERMELAQRAGRSVIWEWRVRDDRMHMSASATSLYGISESEIPATGTQLRDMILPEDRDNVASRLRQSMSEGKPYSAEHRIRLPSGQIRWVSAQGQITRGRDGELEGLIGVSADITDRKVAEEALRTEREHAQVTLDSIGDGVIRTDRAGRVDFMNAAAEHLTGWTLDQARNAHISDVYCASTDGAGRRRSDPVLECLRTGYPTTSPEWCSLVRRDGVEFAIRDSAAPLVNTDGDVFGAVLAFTDVSHTLSLEREMAFLASHDSLTGLLNRREFELALSEALARAKFTGARHALCFVDLDAFKLVNDACGHAAGDEMLLRIATALESKLDGSCTLARLGGDEFGLLMLDRGLEQARAHAAECLQVLNDVRFLWDDRVFQVGASIGIVPVDHRSESLEGVLAAADAACYVAKERGRNQIHVSRPDDHEVATRHREMRWIQRINAAFAEDRFRLALQRIVPIADSASPQIVELLLRMMGDDDTMVHPGHFLPAAERYRMMPAIDQWVVHHGLRAIHRLQRHDPGDTLYALNLSGQSIGDPGLLGLILNEIESAEVPSATLCFEITETAAVSNLAAAQSFISALSERGCRFALDDFGSGLSSFRYLRHLHVQFLKIDGNLVRDMASDPIHREMVAAIHRIGEAMGLRTIGEWVEDQRALKALREVGVDYAQGYWLSGVEEVPRT